ncbi:putative reverse transcriptase domain-containing protein [Tanacetum coccineum]|uniref:Reverse transcriptase domain-containing protein n=1 Tax=Tanacetum coccineum TaxID=301880 RepID=A0ABQ4WD47_9ASTR
MQVGEIHNFKQEEGETLCQTWERFNDILFKCPFHDLNDYQKERAYHSNKWHHEESDRKTSNNNSNCLSTITEKLINLNHDMNDLRKNIHKIHQRFSKEFRHEEVKSIKAWETKPMNNLKETLEQYLEESRLGNPRLVNMVIKMADRSMQYPKGIVENVLVKICKFIFPVDFVTLDIIEDNKVPIILRRPMLATAHARIDVWGGGGISLEVGKEQIIFNANEGATPVTVSPICVIKDFDDNDLLLDYEDPGAILLSSNKYPGKKWDPVGEFQDSNDNLSVGIYDFVAIDDLWDDLDPGALTNEQPLKPKFLSSLSKELEFDVSLARFHVVKRDKNQVCLLCEVILKQIPAFNFFCASFELITAIEITWKWVLSGLQREGMGRHPLAVPGFCWAGKMEFG